MGYQIVYEGASSKKTKVRSVSGNKRVIIWCVTIILVFCICSLGWRQTNIWHYLLPGDPYVTGNAVENLVEEIRSGISVPDAVSAFCKEIVAHAKGE